MPELKVSRVETRSGQRFGVVLGRSKGVACYTMLPREDAIHYADLLGTFGQLTLTIPAWKLTRVSDGVQEQLGG